MSFAEEKGIWEMNTMTNSLEKHYKKKSTKGIGLLPQSKFFNIFPDQSLSFFAKPTSVVYPFNAYKVFWFTF